MARAYLRAVVTAKRLRQLSLRDRPLQRPRYPAAGGEQSFSIGVLVPELSDGYSVLIMNGIEEVLIEEGYFYLTASHRRKADLIEEYPRLLMDRSVEGFIASATALVLLVVVAFIL